MTTISNSCLPELIDLDKDQGHDEIHHGCIKLETQIRGAHMENATQNPLHYYQLHKNKYINDCLAWKIMAKPIA